MASVGRPTFGRVIVLLTTSFTNCRGFELARDTSVVRRPASPRARMLSKTGQPFTVNSIFENGNGRQPDGSFGQRQWISHHGRSTPAPTTDNSDTSTPLAPVGQDGRVCRNTFSRRKHSGTRFGGDETVLPGPQPESANIRTEIFNFINRENFGIQVRLLEAPGCKRPTP